MIARLGRGIIRANDTEAYLLHLCERVIPAYRAADGNYSTHVLLEEKGEFVSILLLSFWESPANLQVFADPQLDPAIHRIEREFVLASETVATVYQVINERASES